MNFREKIEKRREIFDNTALANNNAQEESFDTDYFGIENLRNHLACLDLRFDDGNRKAIPYSYIMEINFDATEGIEVITATKRVIITGYDLGKLYNYLTAFRVKYVQVNLGTNIGEKGLLVNKILIEEI